MDYGEWQQTMYAKGSKSAMSTQGDIMGMLFKYGAEKIGFQQFQGGGGRVVFELKGRHYQIDAVPIEIEVGERVRTPLEKIQERAVRQAWRFLLHYLKATVGMTLFRPVDELLIPFMLTEGPAGEMKTVAEHLREGEGKIALPSGEDE